MRVSRFVSPLMTLLLPTLFSIVTGCDSTLETGYAPHKLNSNDAERRAYYAPAFSPESHVPKHESTGFSAGQ